MFPNEKKSGHVSAKRIISIVFSAALVIMALSGCMAAGENEISGMTGYGTILYIVVIFAIFYFLLFRPEKKRKKQAEEMRNNITVGNTITTIGGIIGKVVDLSDDFIVIETSEDRVRVKLAKWGISSVGKDTEGNQN